MHWISRKRGGHRVILAAFGGCLDAQLCDHHSVKRKYCTCLGVNLSLLHWYYAAARKYHKPLNIVRENEFQAQQHSAS